MTHSFAVRRFLLLGLCGFVLGLFLSPAAPAQELGVWDGALWQFSLHPKAGNPNTAVLRGRFRVNDQKVYQATTPEEAKENKLDKLVGTFKPGPKKEDHRICFLKLDEFRARGPAGKFIVLKGNSRLESYEPGKGKGNFIAGDGYHWELRVQRIQE